MSTRDDELAWVVWWRDRLRQVDAEGMSPDDVEAVRRDRAAPLPLAYSSFLHVAGRRCGDLWVGTDAFGSQLLGLEVAARELLDENRASFALGARDVVIAMHQGYEFLFLSGDADDPPVYRFSEGDSEVVRVADRLSDLVLGS